MPVPRIRRRGRIRSMLIGRRWPAVDRETGSTKRNHSLVPRLKPSPRNRPIGPLAGIRVIDCSTVLAGPFCTMLLGDLGADVVKIEPPEGDASRGWGPPWVGSTADGTRTAAYYLSVNRNKRSLRL